MWFWVCGQPGDGSKHVDTNNIQQQFDTLEHFGTIIASRQHIIVLKDRLVLIIVHDFSPKDPP